MLTQVKISMIIYKILHNTVVTHKNHTPNSHTYPNSRTFLASRAREDVAEMSGYIIFILYIFNPLVPLIGLIWLGIQNR